VQLIFTLVISCQSPSLSFRTAAVSFWVGSPGRDLYLCPFAPTLSGCGFVYHPTSLFDEVGKLAFSRAICLIMVGKRRHELSLK
jgi:hypothetical protein